MTLKILTLGSASAAVLLLTAGPGLAQSAPAPDGSGQVEEVVVTGLRGSLVGAQQIKRNATQVVDSIVAEDIGKLPDNTVSDALQRVTGIQITRGGGEVGTVLIRGLPDIETLINGRETFTGTGRGVALQDIPSELVAGIDVYKTNTPDQIEGSIAGVVDIRLHRPFDFTGLQAAGNARALYADQIGKWSYIGSGLISDRWTTKDGQEFGLLLGLSYNRRKYEDQTAFNFGFNRFNNAATGGTDLLIPDTVGGLVTDGDRKRTGANFAVQWAPTPDIEVYADGLYTGYRQDYDVNFFVGLPKAGNVTATTAQAGSATAETGGVPVASRITTRDNFTITSKQTFHQETDGYQFDIGARWRHGNSAWATEFTYNKSDVTSVQYVLDTAFVVPQIDYDFNKDGTPSLDFNGYDFTDTGNLNLLTLFDNSNAAHSKSTAWRGDYTYTFDNGGALTNIKAGVRLSRRTGDSGGTNGTGFPLGFLPGANFPGLGTNAPDNIIDGRLGVDGFALASTDFLRSNIEELRALAGLPTSGRAFDPALVFDLEEKTFAAYGQAGFAFNAGAMPIDGVLGVRLVRTETELNAIQVTNFPGNPPPPPLVEPIRGQSDDWNVLPSFTLKARPTDNLILRVVAGETILRPQFAQLDPATSLTQLGITGGTFGSGSGGNANLQAVKSKNLDGSIEYYFSNSGSVSLAGFYKKLNGYIQTYATPEIFPGSNGVPQTFLVARPRNTGDGTLKGLEAAYTQFFDFLPGALSGFGLQANVTLSEGSVEAPPVTGQPITEQPITGVSKYSYNIIGMYEKYGLSVRLAYNWRSKWTDSYSTALPGGRIVVDPLAFLDFSASYNLTDNLTVTVDATNLLNETYHDSFGTSGYTPRDTRQYDRTFGAGIRFRF